MWEDVKLTRSGRLELDQRMGKEIHNMPEEGDEGILNEYSSNLPEARKVPDPVSTKDVQQQYDEGLQHVREEPKIGHPYGWSI